MSEKKNAKNTIPPGYKRTKVGVVPEEWEVEKLKNLSKITSGSTPSRGEEKFFKNGMIPWVKTTDLNNGLIFDTEEKITEYAIKKTNITVFPKNSILIAMYGGFNQIGRTGLLKIKAASNQALSVVLPNEKIDPMYLLNFLNHRVFYWKRFAASSRKDPNITKADVEDFPIIKPPLKEQQKIAEILTTWDRAIEKLEALIAAKERLKKGLMQKLLSGEVRFEGFDGEWKEVRLWDIFSERTQRYKDIEKNEAKKYSELLSVSVNSGVTRRSDNDTKDNSNSDKSNYKILKPNDIAYNTMRMWQGASGVSTLHGIVSPAYTVVYLKKDFCIDFFGLLFKSHRVVFDFFRYSQGLTSDTWNLKYPHFSEVKVYIPETKQEQQKIAQVLATADKEIELLKNELETLKAQKSGLMQKLLTGGVRVKIEKGVKNE